MGLAEGEKKRVTPINWMVEVVSDVPVSTLDDVS